MFCRSHSRVPCSDSLKSCKSAQGQKEGKTRLEVCARCSSSKCQVLQVCKKNMQHKRQLCSPPYATRLSGIMGSLVRKFPQVFEAIFLIWFVFFLFGGSITLWKIWILWLLTSSGGMNKRSNSFGKDFFRRTYWMR